MSGGELTGPVVEALDAPVEMRTASAAETTDLGRRLGSILRSGDVLILEGDLGAGKTTLTQGLAAALGVRGDVTSPTFVLSRVHAAQRPGGPALVHVDAYRLQEGVALDDLDLDSLVEDAVTVVEWGAGLAEQLSTDRLHVSLARGVGGDCGDGDARVITVAAVGARWDGVPLHILLAS